MKKRTKQSLKDWWASTLETAWTIGSGNFVGGSLA